MIISKWFRISYHLQNVSLISSHLLTNLLKDRSFCTFISSSTHKKGCFIEGISHPCELGVCSNPESYQQQWAIWRRKDKIEMCIGKNIILIPYHNLRKERYISFKNSCKCSCCIMKAKWVPFQFSLRSKVCPLLCMQEKWHYFSEWIFFPQNGIKISGT